MSDTGGSLAAPDRVQIVRECYRAYETGERALLERHLSEDFRFSSPADVGIDLATYWERCWPNAGRTAGFELTRLVESGDEVIVTYVATRIDGTRFRNTEVMTFDGERVREVEVYFGWNLD
jgi:ketosteroid isomerase-like protein